MISWIVFAAALIWMCQPRSLIRFASGSIISGVVTPPCARLKRMPRAPCSCMRLRSASVDAGIDDHDGPCCRPKRGDRVQCRGVLGAVGRGLHDDVAAGADAFLELAVILDRGVSRPQGRARIDLVLRAVEVMVAVAGIGRRLELRRFGPARPFDLLRGGVARSVHRECRKRGTGRCRLEQIAAVPGTCVHNSLLRVFARD